MIINLYDLFPEEVSDETAFHIVNIFMDITSALESRYFAQVRRYLNEKNSLEIPECVQSNKEDDNSF